MLERLDDISWSDYTDWYASPATDFPRLIQQLHGDDADEQKAALDEVFDRICHQASVLDLTAVVIPFLVELLSNTKFVHEDKLIGHLRTLAIGLDSDLLQGLTRIDDYVAKLQSDALSGYTVGLQCYTEVNKAVCELIRFLDDSHRMTRIEAAYTLAWFPEDVQQTLPLLRHKLHDAEQAAELTNLILSVGLLEYQVSTKQTEREFVRPFLDDPRPLVRYAAAIYLDWHEPRPEVGRIMLELSKYEDFEPEESIPFNHYCYWFQYSEKRVAKYLNPVR